VARSHGDALSAATYPLFMRYRRVIVLVLMMVGGLTSPIGRPTGAQVPAPAPDPPNFLIIVTDDQRATEGTLKVMPLTRQWLKERGTSYPRAFATTPLCCPSRASIFTGRYAHNHGVYTNLGKPSLEHDWTIQGYLDAAYKTGMVGKFFNEWPLRRSPPHFDRYAMFDGGYHNRTYNVQGEMKEVAMYSTRFMGRKAIDFLQAFEGNDGRPWMMYVAPYSPHAPFIPRRKHLHSSVPSWNGNPAVFESDRSDKPAYVRLRNEKFETWKKNRRLQLRALKSVDELLHKLKRNLRELEETKDTIVFFMSDNGYMWADHGLFDKGAPYTPSIGIPMMIRVPGEGGPTKDRRLVANIDVAPTILDAAGISPDPAHPMDGRSLLDATWDRDRILTEYRNNDNVWTPPTWASLRMDRFQYTEYYSGGERIFREYYNLTKDPWQLRNLLHDGKPSTGPSKARLASLSSRLAADRQCTGAACP
jgi:arylsulfatase A-like enzyme